MWGSNGVFFFFVVWKQSTVDNRSRISPRLVASISYVAKEPRFSCLYSRADSQENTVEEIGKGNDQIAQAIQIFSMMHTSSANTVTLAKAPLNILTGQITKILRHKTEMELGKPLMAYGLDSPATVELRGWMR